MKIENIIRWNTGAHYTANGQRIAAMAIDGGVYMSDKDRGIQYFMPECSLNQSEIMRRYLHNENCKYASGGVIALMNEYGSYALEQAMHEGQ